MTQLGELRDAWPAFQAAGVKLYAISYDDVDALSAFAEANDIPYPLLSDVDSAVIRRYGILNTQVLNDGGLVYGVPFPGTYVVDEAGVVIEKFFYDTYKRRQSAEILLDSAVGRVLLGTAEPCATAGDDDIRITAALHGGGGTLKQGAMRRVVVRFEMREGLHIYGEPVPAGMIATRIDVNGPDGLVVQDPILPPTTPLRLEGLDVDLHVWSGTVDLAVPVYALSSLASELRPLDGEDATLEVTVHYQACDDRACLAPRSEKFTLRVPIEPIDVPDLPIFVGNGQRETTMASKRHLLRLMLRKARTHPIVFLRFIGENIRGTLAARRRARSSGKG